MTADNRQSRRSADPRDTAVFRTLDRLVAVDFLQSLPDEFKSCLGVGTNANGPAVDADLYLVHVLPYAATISLHNAHIDYSNPGCPSAVRCIQAARSIIRNYFLLTSTLFDIKRLHPFVTVRVQRFPLWGSADVFFRSVGISLRWFSFSFANATLLRETEREKLRFGVKLRH